MMKTNALLEKISQYIHHYLDNKKSISYGVLGGDMGCLYYLFQMNKFSLDETDPYKYLSEIIRVLNSTHIVHSYCNGIAGLGYTLNILEKEGLVYNVDNNLSFFDDELFRWYSISLKNEDIDPLHGALGALLYFSIRYEYNPTICRLALKQWGDYLNTHLEKVNNGFTIGFRTFEKTPPYNLSLSHGLSGLITITIEALKNIPIANDSIIIRTLRELGEFLSRNVHIASDHISCTPSFSFTTDIPNQSRLAWCYGDLGVALALFKLGNFIGHSNFIDTSKNIILHASKRRKQQDTLIMDRCLCHGSSGVYIMFKYFNDHLFNGNLSECVNYWFDYTYNEAISNPDLYCKRFLFYNNETAKYELRTNILDGISGLGLGLISNSNNLDKLIFLT